MAFMFMWYLVVASISLGVLIFGIGLLIMLPLFIYSFPYIWWTGWTNSKSKYPKTANNGLLAATVNATKLYKHWIFHKELEFLPAPYFCISKSATALAITLFHTSCKYLACARYLINSGRSIVSRSTPFRTGSGRKLSISNLPASMILPLSSSSSDSKVS